MVGFPGLSPRGHCVRGIAVPSPSRAVLCQGSWRRRPCAGPPSCPSSAALGPQSLGGSYPVLLPSSSDSDRLALRGELGRKEPIRRSERKCSFDVT